MEEVDGRITGPVLEETNEQPSAPAPESIPKLKVTDSNSENMAYVPGFGWIESQGPDQVEYAENMCKNGGKIGIMG